MRVTRGLVLALALLAGGRAAAAQELWPGATYDPAIPTIKSVLGHELGEAISTPEELTMYLRALAAAAPDRTYLFEYARTWERRPLHVLVIGSPARIARLAALKTDLQHFADPRTISADDADRLVHELPVVIWLMHAVHGNEISSSDAALVEAYHLLASKNDPVVDAIRKDALVLIDPLENPDGRSRFVSMNGLGQAATPVGWHETRLSG